MEKEIFDVTYTEDLYNLTTPMTVVIDQEWADLTDVDRILLGKILGSVKQNLNAVRIITAKNPEPSSFAAGTRVLCFGAALSPAIPFYTATTIDGTTFLQAETLSALDDIRKKNLWAAMKQNYL